MGGVPLRTMLYYRRPIINQSLTNRLLETHAGSVFERQGQPCLDRSQSLFQESLSQAGSAKGGCNCYRESVTYTIFCEECGIEVAANIGETGRNGFSRGCGEHWDKLDGKDLVASQQNRPPSKGRYCVLYTMRVTGGYSEPLDRQLMERIQISNFGGSQMKATINGHQIFTFYRSFFFFNRQCLKRNRQI